MTRYEVYYLPTVPHSEDIASLSTGPLEYGLSGSLEECAAWVEQYIRRICPDYDFNKFRVPFVDGPIFYLWDKEINPNVQQTWISMKPERLELTLWRRDEEKGLLVNPQEITSHNASTEGLDYLMLMAERQCRNINLDFNLWENTTDNRGSLIAELEANSQDGKFLFMVCTPYHVAALTDEIPSEEIA